jgi:hypothetical protein
MGLSRSLIDRQGLVSIPKLVIRVRQGELYLNRTGSDIRRVPDLRLRSLQSLS